MDKKEMQKIKNAARIIDNKFGGNEGFIGCGVGLDYTVKILIHHSAKKMFDIPKEVDGYKTEIEYIDYPRFV